MITTAVRNVRNPCKILALHWHESGRKQGAPERPHTSEFDVVVSIDASTPPEDQLERAAHAIARATGMPPPPERAVLAHALRPPQKTPVREGRRMVLVPHQPKWMDKLRKGVMYNEAGHVIRKLWRSRGKPERDGILNAHAPWIVLNLEAQMKVREWPEGTLFIVTLRTLAVAGDQRGLAALVDTVRFPAAGVVADKPGSLVVKRPAEGERAAPNYMVLVYAEGRTQDHSWIWAPDVQHKVLKHPQMLIARSQFVSID